VIFQSQFTRYRALRGAHYRNTNAAILVFDLTEPHSFDAVAMWLAELRNVTFPTIKIVLVGNKSDLSGQVISTQDAQTFAEKNGCCGFFCTSAKLNTFVQEAFYCAVEEAVKFQEQERADLEDVVKTDSINLEQGGQEKERTCCF